MRLFCYQSLLHWYLLNKNEQELYVFVGVLDGRWKSSRKTIIELMLAEIEILVRVNTKCVSTLMLFTNMMHLCVQNSSISFVSQVVFDSSSIKWIGMVV